MKNLWQTYARLSFMTKMTAGFVLGAILGLLLKENAAILAPLGTLFLNLLKMVVVPLILLSLIVAVNHSNPIELGRIGLKIFPFYLISTAIAIVVGVLIGKLVNPGIGLSLPTTDTIKAPDRPSFLDTFLNMVPTNPFKALANGDILAVVFVAIVIGLTILLMRHAQDNKTKAQGTLLLDVADACNEATMKVLSGILWYAPIGVFGITAHTFGSQGLDTILALGKFVLASYLGVLTLFVVVFPVMLKLAGVKVMAFYRQIKEAMFTAFVTCSSLGTLPVTLRAAQNAGINERVAKLTLPVGATVNMNGTAIRFGVAIIFASQIMGMDLSITQIASIVLIGTMAAVGTAGAPGAGLIGMSIVFSQAGFPIEIVALTAGVNVVLDMIFTCGNVTGDLIGAKIVNQSEQGHQGS